MAAHMQLIVKIDKNSWNIIYEFMFIQQVEKKDMGAQAFQLPNSTLKVLQSVNRLQAVAATGLTGDKTSLKFDQICSMASSVFNAPVAQITLMEEHRQCIKKSLGFEMDEAPTSISFCACTISSDKKITILKNTLEDEIFKNNPYVIEPPYVRFYAGCPVAFEGEKVGTLCVYDFQPREEVSDEQTEFIIKLAQDAEAAIYGEQSDQTLV